MLLATPADAHEADPATDLILFKVDPRELVLMAPSFIGALVAGTCQDAARG